MDQGFSRIASLRTPKYLILKTFFSFPVKSCPLVIIGYMHPQKGFDPHLFGKWAWLTTLRPSWSLVRPECYPIAAVTMAPGYPPILCKVCECQQLSMRYMPFEGEDLIAISFITETIAYAITEFCLSAVLGLHPSRRPLCLSVDVWASVRAVSSPMDSIFLEKLIKWQSFPGPCFPKDVQIHSLPVVIIYYMLHILQYKEYIIVYCYSIVIWPLLLIASPTYTHIRSLLYILFQKIYLLKGWYSFHILLNTENKSRRPESNS